MSTTISKSKFCAGVQCLKRLYLLVHEPKLATELDAASEAIMAQGREVGLLARQLFPNGTEVDGSRGLEEAIRATRELVANSEVPAIFEGTFEHNGVLVRVDVLHRRRDERWQLIEVKSTTEVKEHHLEDVAIQHRVVRRSGINLASSCLAHVNREYVYEGGPIDVHRLFKIRNLTRQVESLQPELTVQLRSEFRILAMPEAPNISAGRQCSDPFTCEFFDHCNPPIPKDHILRLPRIHASTVAKLVALGVQSIRDIPENYPLPERLRRACTSVQMEKPWYSPELKDELGKLKYPIYFADFETLNPALPRFAGMRPYRSDQAELLGYPRVIDGLILLYGSTCANEIGLSMTLAHELQHTVQQRNNRQLWAVNGLVHHVGKEVLETLKMTWADIPIEHEARIVAKRVAVHIFGEKMVIQFIEQKIREHASDGDFADWQFIHDLRTTDSVDLLAETRRLFQRLQDYGPELESGLRKRREHDQANFSDIDLDRFFTNE